MDETGSLSSGRAEGAGAFRPLNIASISMAFRPGLYRLRKDVVFVWLNLHLCFFLGHDFKACPERSRMGAKEANKIDRALAPAKTRWAKSLESKPFSAAALAPADASRPFQIPRLVAVCFSIAFCLVLCLAPTTAEARSKKQPRPEPPQETGFLNRKVEVQGTTYRFQVYLPEEWRRDDHKQWPVILSLHGRGERGSEGMWQTQIGLPLEVRDHPERWPFVIVMPQCPQANYWTDGEMLTMVMAALDQETAEFRGDPERIYLTGLSMGGYGAWELARRYPKRWAAIAIMSGGVFWTYAPERWQEMATLPAEYARAVAGTPIWMFHGSDDNVIALRQSDLMFTAFKAVGGHVRLWVYQGLRHDSWSRAYNEPELPRWLLTHRAETRLANKPEPPGTAERLVIPLHPPAIKLAPPVQDSIAGEYRDLSGHLVATLFRQGDQLYEKDSHGDIGEMLAESQNIFFYPNASSFTRLTIERDSQGRVTGAIFRDDRHEERWEKRGVIR